MSFKILQAEKWREQEKRLNFKHRQKRVFCEPITRDLKNGIELRDLKFIKNR